MASEFLDEISSYPPGCNDYANEGW